MIGRDFAIRTAGAIRPGGRNIQASDVRVTEPGPAVVRPAVTVTRYTLGVEVEPGTNRDVSGFAWTSELCMKGVVSP